MEIAIYGSTGSIGKQTIEVAKENNFRVSSVICNKNIVKLEEQVRELKPKFAGAIDENAANELRKRIRDTNTKVVAGIDGCMSVCLEENVDTIVHSAVGVAGLVPTLKFMDGGKNIALANKESLVVGGTLIRELARKLNIDIAPVWNGKETDRKAILPIDSEHSTILQLLQGGRKNDVEKITLTASGGPFRKTSIRKLKRVTPEQASKHPTWNMGGRITIDSATLMNKGFEVIEAKWLFGLSLYKIEVVVHPQSIVHSLVHFTDGNVKALLSVPNMKLPIQYSLTYPDRTYNSESRLDLETVGHLDFEKPDMQKFKCLGLAYDALRRGGTAPAVLNGADEKAVELFMKREIRFLDIPEAIGNALRGHESVNDLSLSSILDADKWARRSVASYAADKYKGKSPFKSRT